MHLSSALLTFPAIMAVFALCAMFQRRRATSQNGWRHLRPGPMFWLGLVCGILLTAGFTLGALSRHSTPYVVGIAAFFNLITITILFVTIREDVRWNSTHLERRTLTGEIRRMAWSELAAFGYEASGYHWVRSYDGPKIRFQHYNHGFSELMAMIRRHLPKDGPPAESIAVPALVRIAEP